MFEAQTPTDEELSAIASAVARKTATAPTTLRALRRCAIAKFPNFVSDNPVYQGPLYVVVWPDGPEKVDVITVGSGERLLVNCVDSGEADRDVWSDDIDFPREDWRLDVQNNDTNQGYWCWVRSQREANTTFGGGKCR